MRIQQYIVAGKNLFRADVVPMLGGTVVVKADEHEAAMLALALRAEAEAASSLNAVTAAAYLRGYEDCRLEHVAALQANELHIAMLQAITKTTHEQGRADERKKILAFMDALPENVTSRDSEAVTLIRREIKGFIKGGDSDG